MEQKINDIVENVEKGYYNEHQEGLTLLRLDIQEVVEALKEDILYIEPEGKLL